MWRKNRKRGPLGTLHIVCAYRGIACGRVPVQRNAAAEEEHAQRNLCKRGLRKLRMCGEKKENAVTASLCQSPLPYRGPFSAEALVTDGQDGKASRKPTRRDRGLSHARGAPEVCAPPDARLKRSKQAPFQNCTEQAARAGLVCRAGQHSDAVVRSVVSASALSCQAGL